MLGGVRQIASPCCVLVSAERMAFAFCARDVWWVGVVGLPGAPCTAPVARVIRLVAGACGGIETPADAKLAFDSHFC